MIRKYTFGNPYPTEAVVVDLRPETTPLPYIYSEYMKACLGVDMLFKPLSFEYEDDPHAAQEEDQLMMGESIMITPVLHGDHPVTIRVTMV